MTNIDFNKIYPYTNVEGFKLHPNNRSIDDRIVKAIKKKMVEGKWDTMLSKVIVDANTMQIYDGQHRIAAYKLAQEEGYKEPIPVEFISAPDTLEEQISKIQDLNSGKHWGIKDHINCHKGGDNDLLKLEELCKKYPLLHKVAKSGKNKGHIQTFERRGAALLTGRPKYYRTALKDGTFKATKNEWEEVDDMYEEVTNVIKALKLNNQTDNPSIEGIINGWSAIHNNTRLQKNISQLPNGLNDVYKYLEEGDSRHTTSAEVWETRFRAAVENAHNCEC